MSHSSIAERIAVFRPLAFPGTEILAVANCLRRWHVFHETYTFCAATKGAGVWRYRTKTYSPNRCPLVILLEPGETHYNTAMPIPADFNVLSISPEVFVNAAKELGLPVTPHFELGYVEDPKLGTSMRQFCASVAAADNALEQQSWFVTCVRRLLEYAERELPAPATIGHRAVERAKSYLQERYTESVTLDELAAVAGLSRFHLVRTFAKHIGLPPHAYQTHIRIERAKALLRAGMPPATVATTAGFADQSHFTRHFKNIVGATPNVYVQAVG